MKNKTVKTIVTLLLCLTFMANLFINVQASGTGATGIFLTSKEKEWLDEHSTLRVGYVSDYMPFCGTDSEGNVTGIITDVFDGLLTNLGYADAITVEYKEYVSFLSMNEGLKAGEVDLTFPGIGRSDYLKESGVLGSIAVIKVPMYVAYTGEYNDETFARFALNSRPLKKISQDYSDSKILSYASANDCLDAVINGEASCTVMASYRLSYLLYDEKYKDIVLSPFDESVSYCICVDAGQSVALSIINKGVNSLDDALIMSYLFNYIQSGDVYTADDFFHDNIFLIAGITLAVLLILLLGLVSYIIGIKKAQKQTEKQLEENKKLSAEKEEHYSKAIALNKELQQKEKDVSEALSQVQQIAALSLEYEAIHVADLDEATFSTIRMARSTRVAGIDNEAAPYMESVQKIVNKFVLPEKRTAFLRFLEIDNLKAKMEQERRFSYRYPIVADETGKYIYEMNFVRVSDEPDKHVLVIGTKCIDDMLKMEREEGQYNAALLNECSFFYEFDVTDGYVRGGFRTSKNYKHVAVRNIEFPISYDKFNEIRGEELEMTATTPKEAEYWTCQGLKDAYALGKRVVEIRYSSEKLGYSWVATIILTEDSTTHHLHAVYICKDVTESVIAEVEQKRELERALEEAKRANAAKSDFLSRMSHDIRTPLNGIIGLIEINEKHSDDIELQQANRKKAKVAANHLLSLINDVLDMSKLEDKDIELPYEPFNIIEVCSDVLTICGIRARENGITPSNDGGTNIKYPNVYGSPLHFKQILMNIVNNAIKYNKPGGTFCGTTRMLEYDGETAVYSFIVKDTGIGMSAEFMKDLYKPFTQERNDARSRYQGTGMGMAIVKTLVDKMNGTIEVESEVGVGTTFTVSIPFKINHDVKPEDAGLQEYVEYSIEGMKLLLVEDNELNQEIAQMILEDAGAHVTLAENGQVAYETFVERPAGTFDAILMDIMMPVLDGYGATEKIRKADKADAQNIPIIAMTANAFAEDVAHAKASGMNDHLSKPLQLEVLMRVLSGYNR